MSLQASQEPTPQDPATTRIDVGSLPPGPRADATPLGTQDSAMVSALRPGTALLLILRGPSTGARYLLDVERTSVGRHPENDIVLDDVTVSRHHTVFEATEVGFRVVDTGSTNGTYVNRDEVTAHDLSAGDEVQVGKFHLSYYPAPAGGDLVSR